MSTSTFTAVHVVLSLIGIFSGSSFCSACSARTDSRTGPRCFSRQHGVDERDRVLLSLRAPHAVPCGRRHLAGGAGGHDPRAFCLSTRRTLALDLRGRRCTASPSGCLRGGGPGVPEAVVSEPTGANAV